MFSLIRLCSRCRLPTRKLFDGPTFILERHLIGLPNQESGIEDEILDALHSDGKAPVSYARIPQFVTNKSERPLQQLSNNKKTLPKAKKDVIIQCKNAKLNHHKNQRYPDAKLIPLASAGWFHYKAKGDHFTIKVCNDKEFVESLFWDESIIDFHSFHLNPSLVDAIKESGLTRPTKIQTKAIPALLSGRNCLVTAETGCGKTLAYLIPIINQVLNWTKHLPAKRDFNQPLALILVPSRDLAHQIGDVARRLSFILPFRSQVLVGGRMKRWMLQPEFELIDIQIATPGALSKLVSTNLYDLSKVRHVVLDEGDTMLDDSFNDTIRRLLAKVRIGYGPSFSRREAAGALPSSSQFTIVSATMPRDVYSVLDSIVETDSLKEISTERLHHVLPHVTQTFYRVGPAQKPEKLLELVTKSIRNGEKVIIFSNQSKTSDWISLTLKEKGIEAINLNKAMPDILRKNKLIEFQKGSSSVLSCTDIASRGIDTVEVKHIINFDFPKFMADYVHRCGRTGRIGSHLGCRVSNLIATDNDVKLVQKIETAVRNMTALPSVNGNISKIIQDRLDRLEKKITSGII